VTSEGGTGNPIYNREAYQYAIFQENVVTSKEDGKKQKSSTTTISQKGRKLSLREKKARREQRETWS